MPHVDSPSTHFPSTLLRRLAVVMAMPLLGACATSSPASPPETPEAVRRADVEADLTLQLARIQHAYVKLAAARDDVVSALGIDGLSTIDPSLAMPIDPVETCPHRVRDHARRDDGESQLRGHERRLASSLVMLDEELSEAGEPTLGCSR